MKVRDSGMPEQDYWESLFDVPGILNTFGVDKRIHSAVEVGCGYGTFTVPIAKRISGQLHAFDIEPTMIAATEARLRAAAIGNVELSLRDVIADGFGLAERSMDGVFLFNIMHAENPTSLLRASAQLLVPNGRVYVIHWRSDIATPRGPDLSIRPRPDDVIHWARETGVLNEVAAPLVLPPWHFGIVLQSR